MKSTLSRTLSPLSSIAFHSLAALTVLFILPSKPLMAETGSGARLVPGRFYLKNNPPITDDPSFRIPVPNPMHPSGDGPVVVYDEGHHNQTMSPHVATPTVGGTAAALGRYIRDDGYSLRINKARFSPSSLADAQVLIIAGPTAEDYIAYDKKAKMNYLNTLRASRPAFTDAEVRAVSDWVSQGGSLILVYDHAPFAPSAQGLASAFGVDLHNPNGTSIQSYNVRDGSIVDPGHPIFQGRGGTEVITRLPQFNILHYSTQWGKPLLRYNNYATRNDVSTLGEHAFLKLSQCISSNSFSKCGDRDVTTFLSSLRRSKIGGAAALSEIPYKNHPSDPGGKVFVIGNGSKIAVQLSSTGLIGGGLRDPENAQLIVNLIRYSAGDLN